MKRKARMAIKTKTKVIIGATLTAVALSTLNIGRAGTAENSVTNRQSASNPKKQSAITLESIRQSIAANEKLLNPIRLRFTNTFETKEELTLQLTHFRQLGRRYSLAQCEWAQKGEKHYARIQYFYRPEEVAQTWVYVMDETNWWSARWPDLTQRSKSSRAKLKWNAEIGITILGLRPFEG
ncbi:MAG: hypothetical protein NTY64_14715, partial [Deltaproteobacteria bacterium]|nr:hypothetical protein [Deltaproteobacteria bacterium]